MMVSSAEVLFRSDPPFAPVDDLSFRRIPAGTPAALIRPSHPSPIRRPELIDINVVHPAERLSDSSLGRIGAVTDHHQSILGAIKSLVPLVTELGPAMAADAHAAGATLVMLVPLCPACHQTIGLLARVFEREGLTTVTVTGARDITERVRPPRAAWLDFPLGNSLGRPNEPEEQRAICLDVLRLATSAERHGRDRGSRLCMARPGLGGSDQGAVSRGGRHRDIPAAARVRRVRRPFRSRCGCGGGVDGTAGALVTHSRRHYRLDQASRS